MKFCTIMMTWMLTFTIYTSQAISISEINGLIRAGTEGWKLFNYLFYSETGNNKAKSPPRLLVVYQGKRRLRTKYIHFDTKVQHATSEGPLEDVLNVAQKLVKNKKIDVAAGDCDLIYYEFIDKQRQQVDLSDEADLMYLMSQPGDKNKGNVRLIEVLCGPVPKPEREPEVNLQLYKDNEKAFEHVIAEQKQITHTVTNNARDSLNKAGIGGFSVESKGYAGLDMDASMFESYVGGLAKAWGWNEKITSQLDMVTGVGKQFSGTFNVWFEPAKWKIMGDYQRFASFRTKEEKYSMYVATSQFEYVIPSEQREGDLLDRWGVKGGGAISGEYFEQVGHLMEGEALKRFQVDISRPKLEDYQKHEL